MILQYAYFCWTWIASLFLCPSFTISETLMQSLAMMQWEGIMLLYALSIKLIWRMVGNIGIYFFLFIGQELSWQSHFLKSKKFSPVLIWLIANLPSLFFHLHMNLVVDFAVILFSLFMILKSHVLRAVWIISFFSSFHIKKRVVVVSSGAF